MQFSPLQSNGSQRVSNATLAFCQTLSTPLSFWEYQQQQQAKTKNNNSVVSNANIGLSQIVAEDVVVELASDAKQAKISRLSASEVSFTLKCAAIDTDAIFVNNNQDNKKITAKPGSGNVFICNNCLIAIKPISQDEELFIDPITLDAKLFMELTKENRMKLVGFTEPSLRAILSSQYKLQVDSTCPKLDVYRASEHVGEALRCIAPIEEGEVLYNFNENNTATIPFNTLYTMSNGNATEYGVARHFNITGGCQCIFHSCDPNTIIDNDSEKGVMKVIACKKINPGDHVSFNYNATEWDMDAPFECHCGAEQCHKYIAGFRNLKKQDQERLLADPKANGISEYIVKLTKISANGASDPALRYVATDNFFRGSIVSVGIGKRLRQATHASVNGTAQKDLIFHSSTPSSSSSSSSSLEVTSAPALTSATSTGIRNRESFFPHFEVSLKEMNNTAEEKQQGETSNSNATASSSSSALNNLFSSLSSSSCYTPCGAQVGNTIVALRDIQKGEVVTIRNIVTSESSKNDDNDDGTTTTTTTGLLTESVAQQLSAHILQLASTNGEQQQEKSDFNSVLIQGSGLNVDQQRFYENEAKALQAASELIKGDAATGRSSLLVLYQQDKQQVGALFIKNRIRDRE